MRNMLGGLYQTNRMNRCFIARCYHYDIFQLFHCFRWKLWSLRLYSLSDKTIKLWKVSEREKQAFGYNLKEEDGRPRRLGRLVVPRYEPMELMIEASPKKVFANAHTYHINSISVNSDNETYLSADDLRINLWHLEITDRSFSKSYYAVEIHSKHSSRVTTVIAEVAITILVATIFFC